MTRKGEVAGAAVRRGGDHDAIAAAAEMLRAGGLVAFPTETVYGLGADATNAEAVAALYAAKGRPAFNPLIAHVDSLDTARRIGRFNDDALRLAAALWPGPLTLVVPAVADCSVALLARAGLDSVALRVPAHPLAQALLARLGRPVAAPSANRSGAVSPTTADHVMADLDGRIDMVLDGGPTAVGIESAIVSCLGDGAVRLLRPGGIARSAVQSALGRPLDGPAKSVPSAPAAPGMLASHYAPRAGLRLGAAEGRPGEAVLRFAGRPAADGAVMALDLSPAGDLAEAAANLFGHLRALDAAGAAIIAVGSVPGHGLGEAINDRLARAAAPRP